MKTTSAALPFRFDDLMLLYASHDGQARRIAARIAVCLAEQWIAALPRDLAMGVPAAADLKTAPLIAVVSAVRYGRHLRAAERLLAAYKESGSTAPLIFVSVSLTARKPGRSRVENNQYLRASLQRHGVAAAFATAVAGRLDYPRYRWPDRQIIRLIMKLTGGPTNPRSCTEFTDWDAVDAIADRITELRDHCDPAVVRRADAFENRIQAD
ncbi:MAG TPA: flavodoxin domain-containing protein [Acetobacteraceae bacterium]|jgi:menaquinone-dependent protoporphyrinogen oxidase|nr:flavodoxin domain-containing protein [Acetobacteraceae bacterium]